ncbi:glycosyltransferase family 2 protein [Chryseobacterium sp. NRRL B-14859]|uniref:glycosyltransferase family 2 protein n=1 Tax=Chryseobacterium sp. NRRL B-14859 TaxID=1562763 RepID=UPI0033947A98
MFSIVIPLYNKELSIKNTIESVLKQTIQDYEIIVVNDGSTDRSLEVVQKINDGRIKIIDKENEGVSATRNRGIEEASFEWIAFLDGDDIWRSNHLQIVSEMIKQYPEERLFATSFDYSDGRDVKRSERKRFSIISDYFDESLKEHLIWTSIFISHISCFKINKFNPSLALGEDLELFSRMVKANNLVKCTDITATYRIDAENRSSHYTQYKMNKSFLSMLSFNKMNTKAEKKYFKGLIIGKLKHFVVRKDFKNAWFLVKKYNFNLL